MIPQATPSGRPTRVFDFPLNLDLDPTNYPAASVVNAFYWMNWMHDKLTALGFTETAGNFQDNNFGRGGLENDGVQVWVKYPGANNAYFSTPPTGSQARWNCCDFLGPTPKRDSALDAEIMLHEYTHGLSQS